jgi:hypothetical protein
MLRASKISRRTLIHGAALLSLPGIPVLTRAADAKASKATVHYQENPSGMRMCHMCKFYIGGTAGRTGMMGCGMGAGSMMAPGACQVVEGTISPMGYCDLYAPRGA